MAFAEYIVSPGEQHLPLLLHVLLLIDKSFRTWKLKYSYPTLDPSQCHSSKHSHPFLKPKPWQLSLPALHLLRQDFVPDHIEECPSAGVCIARTPILDKLWPCIRQDHIFDALFGSIKHLRTKLRRYRNKVW